jgi:hypothetical protein
MSIMLFAKIITMHLWAYGHPHKFSGLPRNTLNIRGILRI